MRVHGYCLALPLARQLKILGNGKPGRLPASIYGKPAYTFEQWQFGTSTVKATDLWGYFNAPRPIIKVRPERITTGIGHKGAGRDWSEPQVPDEYKLLNLDRSAKRAITPAGFAQAFFKANK
jgi:hypothetical protein